jgi:hypothetical protein
MTFPRLASERTLIIFNLAGEVSTAHHPQGWSLILKMCLLSLLLLSLLLNYHLFIGFSLRTLHRLSTD